MLVDINLLPKRESRYAFTIVFIVIPSILFIIGLSIFLWLGNEMKSKTEAVQENLHTVQMQIAAEEENVEQNAEIASSQKLKEGIQWVENSQIDTVQLLNGLLPMSGFIHSFTYIEDGRVEFTVQFETNREAAYYLHSLSQKEGMKEAEIKSLHTQSNGNNDTKEALPRYVAKYELNIDKAMFSLKEKGGKEE
ncbi:hypothetical protein [Cytobacillus purgationiresistens]|uniref:Type IV pilus assembly protein PilN n=1 Tax=Cytobacillus purgationiresistens TaxID=863449 RepID=A0ABU0AFE9_9BACI|nr:hypothetical protein [Cytobacillus purgationiresistens]MDQ0269986.1 type IV pilus assembly protein PilN [Cytobacillus purgationiresistens]